MLMISRILAVCFTLRDNSANPDISRIFCSAIRIFFQITDWGLAVTTAVAAAATADNKRSGRIIE